MVHYLPQFYIYIYLFPWTMACRPVSKVTMENLENFTDFTDIKLTLGLITDLGDLGQIIMQCGVKCEVKSSVVIMNKGLKSKPVRHDKLQDLPGAEVLPQAHVDPVVLLVVVGQLEVVEVVVHLLPLLPVHTGQLRMANDLGNVPGIALAFCVQLGKPVVVVGQVT